MTDYIFGGMNNPHKDLMEEVNSILKMGMEFVELTVEWPLSWVDSVELKIKDLRDELESSNAFILVHSPYYLEIAHPYEDVRSGALRVAAKILRIANKLESAFATFHPFTPGWLAAMRDKARELNVLGFRELVREGRELNVQILVENVDHGAFRSPPDIRYLLDNVEGLLMTLDLGHAMMNGGIEKLRAYLRKCRREIMHLHAHDNDMSSDLHMPIGAGKIPWREVAVELIKNMYKGTITLEVHSIDSDYVKISREKLSSILNDVKNITGTDCYQEGDQAP
ncbi:MAG: sugar phosphate isomerase/epimerase [Candidatus Korarchaeum sp.]|nr:sugar phosphate isomerase/epimerase [Candidatus Korarchaeum sp.]